MGNVIKIPANAVSAADVSEKSNALRVAAYARVSTDFEDQQSSFALQVAHYTEYIKNHDGWEFVRVYSEM